MTVYRSKQKKTRKQGKTKRGWFTLEGMKETLKWSKPLVQNMTHTHTHHPEQ